MILVLASLFFGVTFLIVGYNYFRFQKADNFSCFGIIEGLTIVGTLLFGAFFLWASVKIPVKAKDIAYTDAVKVIKIADQYHVSKDGKEIPINHYKEARKENGDKYKLRAVNYCTILGTDAGTEYTLIIPVEEVVLQEG